MKHIEELKLPVRDKTKNYILQLEEKGWKEGKEEGFAEAIKRMIRNGSSTSFICCLICLLVSDNQLFL